MLVAYLDSTARRLRTKTHLTTAELLEEMRAIAFAPDLDLPFDALIARSRRVRVLVAEITRRTAA